MTLGNAGACSSTNATSLCASSVEKSVSLSTAVVQVQGTKGISLGRILFDQGSEVCLVTREFCDRAKLNVISSDHVTRLHGISASNTPIELKYKVKVLLKSRYSNFKIAIEAEVIDKIPYCISRTCLSEVMTGFPYQFAETFELPYDFVDIMIGNEYVEYILGEKCHFMENICLTESRNSDVVSGSLPKASFLCEKFCGLTDVELR